MPYPASLIAYYFVKRGISEGSPVTQMKLQKMVYFAHGIHLILNNEPLIKETFQAWKYGPVIPSIYQTYKFYGNKPIVDTEWVDWIDKKNTDLNTIDKKAIESLDYTWNALKSTNAVQLSNWSHNEGSPWSHSYIPGINDIIIPNEKIQQYFERYLDK